MDEIVKSRHSRGTCPRPDRGTGIQGLRWFPASAGTTSGLLLEFIPMQIGAGMTENSLFRLFTRPSYYLKVL